MHFYLFVAVRDHRFFPCEKPLAPVVDFGRRFDFQPAYQADEAHLV
jgi:hypothetical protein